MTLKHLLRSGMHSSFKVFTTDEDIYPLVPRSRTLLYLFLSGYRKWPLFLQKNINVRLFLFQLQPRPKRPRRKKIIQYITKLSSITARLYKEDSKTKEQNCWFCYLLLSTQITEETWMEVTILGECIIVGVLGQSPHVKSSEGP